MKKIYSTPNAEVVKIATVQMLAYSLNKDTSSPVSPGSGNVLGRQNDTEDDW